MIISMAIAVPWENLGHLLQHVVDGLDLLEGQAGEVGVVELQLTTQLPGPKCSGSSSCEARYQSQSEDWFGSGRANVDNSRTSHLKR